MKIKKADAVAFLVALGFEKATAYDDEKLLSRLGQVPTKVPRDEVPDEWVEIYDALGAEPGNIKLADVEPAKEEKEPKPSDKPAAADKPKDKPAADKPAKKKKRVKEKKEVERDSYGSMVGTVRHAIHAQFSTDWRTDVEMAKAAGVTLTQARLRIRQVQKEGGLEKRNLGVQYRLPAKKAKK